MKEESWDSSGVIARERNDRSNPLKKEIASIKPIILLLYRGKRGIVENLLAPKGIKNEDNPGIDKIRLERTNVTIFVEKTVGICTECYF